MTNFDFAHAFTAKWEGGLIDNPNDPGGITNFGVSLRFLRGFQPSATADTIRQLTKEQAKQIMKRAFWDSQRLDQIPLLPAVAHYDFSVNSGVKQAVLSMQKVLGVTQDGILGPVSKGHIIDRLSQRELANSICEERKNFYARLAENKPALKVFLKGWMNRVNDLEKYLEGINV